MKLIYVLLQAGLCAAATAGCGGSSASVSTAEGGSGGQGGSTAGDSGSGGQAQGGRGGGALIVEDDPIAAFAGEPVEDLDEDERELLCEDVRQTARETIDDDRVREVQCLIRTLPLSPSPEQCEPSVDTCKADLEASEEELPDASLDGVACDEIAPPDCPLTAGEVQACSDEFARQIEQLIDLFTCNRAGDQAALLQALVAARQLQMQIPEACIGVEEQCGLPLSSSLEAATLSMAAP